MTRLTVYNRGRNPIERAGRVFPPRRSVTVDLDDADVDAVRAHRRLSVTDPGDRLEQLTVAQLRERAAARGLDTKGRKAELIARIRAHEAGP